MSIDVREKIRSSRTERFYKNKKRAGLYDMKTKDLFRMEYAQILIYIVFLGLLEVLLFIFKVNYFLMIYLLLIGLILEWSLFMPAVYEKISVL